MGLFGVLEDRIHFLRVKRINDDMIAAMKQIKNSCIELHDKCAGCAECACLEDHTGLCIASTDGLQPRDWDIDLIRRGGWSIVECTPDEIEEDLEGEEVDDDEDRTSGILAV